MSGERYTLWRNNYFVYQLPPGSWAISYRTLDDPGDWYPLVIGDRARWKDWETAYAVADSHARSHW
jgi:hypothetical protein